jgi:hypothetical protein
MSDIDLRVHEELLEQALSTIPGLGSVWSVRPSMTVMSSPSPTDSETYLHSLITWICARPGSLTLPFLWPITREAFKILANINTDVPLDSFEIKLAYLKKKQFHPTRLVFVWAHAKAIKTLANEPFIDLTDKKPRDDMGCDWYIRPSELSKKNPTPWWKDEK